MNQQSPLPRWLSFLNFRVGDDLLFAEKLRRYITLGLSFSMLLSGVAFAVANGFQGNFFLIPHNLLLGLSGAFGVVLVWIQMPRIGFAVISLAAAIIFFSTAVIYGNGTENFLVLAIVVSMFMYDRRICRWSIAILYGIFFAIAKILIMAPSEWASISLLQYSVNLSIFILGMILFLEIYRVVNRNYRRRLEEEHELLEEKTRALRLSNESKERLFAILGHDLRSPVSGLRSVLDLMGSGDLDREQFHDLLDELGRDVGNLEALLENLLAWAATQLEKLKPFPVRYPLHAQVEELFRLHQAAARQKGIHLENGVDKSAEVFADRSQILTVLRNLLSNGIKFSEAGGTVIVCSEIHGNGWLISVADNGVGMPPEKLEDLKKGMIQEPSRGTANEKGFGIGLNICDEFVSANGSQLEISSVPGEGSSFKFYLPG